MTAPASNPETPPAAPVGRAKARRMPVYPGSADALAMLTLRPVFATPVPRLHVGRKGPDGRLVVYDRASGRRFVVYAPRVVSQFRGGHRAGFWYLRPASDVDDAPRSLAFPTAAAAVEALKADRWGLSTAPRYRADPRLRVIWSA